MFRFARSRAFSSSVKILNEQPLYMEPAKWKGLPSDKIFRLFQERVLTLGPKYTKSKEELEALLSTSKDTGFTLRQIQQIYQEGEEAAFNIEKKKFDDSFTTQPFMFDDYSSQAHDIIAEHREQRHYNRIAAYEMPLLAQFRQPYIRPKDKPVSYRYTTYLGESHPAERKVVLSLKTNSLGLNDRQLHKFRLLAGVRFDYLTDEFKMSSDRYPEPAQNVRFLSGVLDKLVKEASDLTDDFSDVPLDTRFVDAKLKKKQHRHKRNFKFPDEWKRPQDAPVEKNDPFLSILKGYS